MPTTPQDRLRDLVAACGKPPGVNVFKGAAETAAADFQLATKAALLEFISEGGLEAPEHINTAPWKNNPNPANPIDVDAFRFSSGPTKRGYIAFFLGPTKLWTIKSFKKDKDVVTTSLADLLAGHPLLLAKGPRT